MARILRCERWREQFILRADTSGGPDRWTWAPVRANGWAGLRALPEKLAHAPIFG